MVFIKYLYFLLNFQALKPELDKLYEAKKKYTDQEGGTFLLFVYKEFPPKLSCQIPDCDEVMGKSMKDLKKLFQKAVINYHPDKQDEEKFGIKWKILCEEITKYLSAFYEFTKGL